MRRYLVVGCGGSGGATLAYMMDQLRSELGAYGFELPAGWQFIHLDVPTAEESGPDGIGNVVQQGGRYVGYGTQGAQYAPVDSSVCLHPRVLDEIATWAPRNPQSVTVPINVGAGQFRAVGRMITLNRATDLHQRLGEVWSDLMRPEADQELARIGAAVPGAGSFDPSQPPVVFVISSMAGGAGASMALDVCRLLNLIRVTGSIGVFMFSADVFDSLPPNNRTGVRGNSLAMVGEIVAAQAGPGRLQDQSLLTSLGLNAGYGKKPPFDRVFPVSRRVGLEHTAFGDGDPKTVYRGLARGLTALMMSDRASHEFVAYDLGNTGQPSAARDAFGWGLEDEAWDPMPWGAFGYASLSTGRERFGEYSAQRIAGGAVDRLVSGHLTPGSSVSSNEQLKGLLDSQWEHECAALGLPRNIGEFMPWLTNAVFPDSAMAARSIATTEVAPNLSPPTGMNGAQFLQTVRYQLGQRRASIATAAENAAYGSAFQWHVRISESTKQVIADGVARHGLAYGAGLLDRLEKHMRDVVLVGAQDGARRGPDDVAAVPTEAERTVSAIRGVIQNAHQVMNGLLEGLLHPVRNYLLAHGCRLIEAFVPAFISEFVSPLRAALNDSLEYLNLTCDANQPLVDIGLARLRTDQYQAWPSDRNQQVPARFTHALNEVLLIKAEDFDEAFRRHLTSSLKREDVSNGYAGAGLSDRASYDAARQIVLTQVIADDWETTGSVRPQRNLIEQTAAWRTRTFALNPNTQQLSVAQDARFDVHARPQEILARARQFVERPGESFETFVRTSLRSLLAGTDGSDADRAHRREEIVAAFTEALDRARPLISVDQEAVRRIHSPATAQYRYKFSEVPFENLAIGDDLTGLLTNKAGVDPESVKIFTKALRGDESNVSRIDIFGSYANFSPIVFDAVLTPASDEWAATPLAGKDDYWRWRRTRPLPASLPLGDAERRAMVSGWFICQVVGELRMPSPPFSEQTGPAEIWDGERGRWLPFPNPLLTPPARFIAEYDWMPAVLESSLLAMANACRPPLFESMRPYQLLRTMHDDSHIRPTAISTLTQTAGERRLMQWLITGNSAGNEPSKVPAASNAATPRERADATLDWLAAINKLAGQEYCPPASETGAPGGGVFSTIGSRRQASATPLFRDLAPDVYLVTNELRNVVQQALARVEAGAFSAPGANGSNGFAADSDTGLLPPSPGVSF